MAGNQGNNKIIWEPWQLDFLKVNFNSMTAEELSQGTGIKRTKVREMYYSLGMKKIELEYWTEEQINFLKASYQFMGDSEISDYFNIKYKKQKGWSKKHAEKKRRYLNLKRTREQIKRIHERNVKAGRFKMCPVNAWKTRGVSKVGEIRQWTNNETGKPFLAVKTKTGFTPYARHLYKKKVGRIPSGMIVTTLDGNPLNVIIENLTLITRAEHAIKNAGYEYPLEIRIALRTINKIKKVIHEKQNR